ncbi:MAG: sulfatase [Planctomycetes bacterium]|nr:sulfatase [Planctomycetota bacterium]
MQRAVSILLGVVLAACGAREPERPNLLLITVDTLRADRMGLYGAARDTTPDLDAFARECVVLDAAQTPRSKTTPAIASLLSGLYPHAHGVRDLATPLSERVPLLQETLRERGYRTGAIVGNWVLGDARSGLARGFDVWCESMPDRSGVPPDDVPQRTARSLTEAALVALGASTPSAPVSESERDPELRLTRGDAPWFLWLHYMDPHGAYEPPAEHRLFERERVDLLDVHAPQAANAEHKRRLALYNVPEHAWVDADHIDAALVRDLYDGELHYVDREIGRLLQTLRASGQLERTVVVVTADHGESLGEHDYWFEHGAYTYESTARVPLIVRAPGLAALRVAEPFSLVDLAPTLKELLGLELAQSGATDALRGRSKLAAWRGAAAGAGAIFSEKVEGATLEGAVQLKAVRIGRWKLIQRYALRASRPGAPSEIVALGEELFDLAADPLEAWNLSSAVPGGAPLLELRRELARFVAADRDLAALGELLAARRRGLEISDPDAARTLRLLGY